jgi:hypothetical protein
MSWTYEIASGRLYSDSGELIGVGYSGAPSHKNDVTAQSLPDLGPIPEGWYTIGSPVDTVTHGPYVLPLTPDPSNQMYGRSGFLMHGDSVVAPGTASEGCLIQARDVREQVGTSTDHRLQVVAQLEESNA